MTHRNIISLSHTEASFLATLAAEGKNIFTTQDAYEVLAKGKPARDSLERLVHKGWLERIERGRYLIVPLEAGPERSWTEGAFVIAQHLVEPSAIGYWSALNHWNLTEQVPRVTHIQTTARKSNRKPNVLGMQFHIVRIKLERFFGQRRFYVGGSAVRITDREKTIIDCLDRPELSGGVAEVAKALHEGDGEFDWRRTTRYLRRFGSGAVVKRLGFLIEVVKLEHAPNPDMLEEWQHLLTAGISKLDPSSRREPHRIATRWRVAVNLPEEALVRPT
jgi:predicted transcriptional regulator of viral defense system